MSRSGTVFVITGPSGVGKGSLIAAVRERVPELEESISATTREPRTGETDGVQYHFLSVPDFQRRIAAGEFLEWAEYSGNLYGTLNSEIERRVGEGTPVILEIEVQGARQIRERMPQAIEVFIAPPRLADLRERLETRGTDAPDVIDARLAVASSELAAREEFRHQVVNRDFDHAVEQLEAIVRAELSQSER